MNIKASLTFESNTHRRLVCDAEQVSTPRRDFLQEDCGEQASTKAFATGESSYMSGRHVRHCGHISEHTLLSED